MQDRDFIYWLQGYLELSEANIGLTLRQVEIIKDHIALVMKKETPPRQQLDFYERLRQSQGVAQGGAVSGQQVPFIC